MNKFIVSIVAALTMFSGCASEKPAPHPLIGYWVLDMEGAREAGGRIDMEFRPDGVRRSVMQQGSGSPVVEDEDRYILRGDELFIVTDSGERKLDYAIRNNRLIIFNRETGEMVWRKK